MDAPRAPPHCDDEATFIVGFPGETGNRIFEETLDLLEEVQYDSNL